MSVKASTWVWEHSPYRDATLIVHLAIADIMNDVHYNELWLTREKLAVKAHTSIPTVTRAIRQMLDDGLLELLERGGGRGKPTRYRFLMPEATGLWVAGETGSNRASFVAGKADQTTPETGSSTRQTGSSTTRIGITQVTQRTKAESSSTKGDPACLRCHGDGVILSSSPGPDQEPFDLPCPCTGPDYERAPAKATRPIVGFGMPAERRRKRERSS